MITEKRRTTTLWKKGKICIKRQAKDALGKLFHVTLKLWLVDLNYNFECDWLIELSDDKLSDNNLASELVENRSL